MPRIELSPSLPNHITVMDWADAGRDLAGFSDALVTAYEDGKVVVLRNPPFRIDYALLNRITLPKGRKYQKMSAGFFARPKLHKPKAVKLFLDVFGLDFRLAAAFRREVADVSEQLRDFARKVFRTYRFDPNEMNVSWRFTETGPEGMHLDSFASNADRQYVRIFVNIDERPRLWHVTERLPELAERCYGAAGLATLRGASGNEFARRLNDHCFEQRPDDGYERHKIEFAQGDVWLCDSRLVSHQIVWGRRMIASHFAADPDSMLDPSKRLDARVRRIHEAHAARAA